jgi:hypothetical protein
MERGGASAHDFDEFPARWKVARAAYGDGQLAAALAAFREAAIPRSDDGPCRAMIERCARLARGGPPEGWDGAWHFERT